jgi:predicted nucleotidyltransferase component of viral defense system
MKIDINKHKFLLVSILKDIYSDTELATSLGFKGGTAQMLFYSLPRFSVDLDFNLIKPSKAKIVFAKVRNILLNYGNIKDEAEKHFGLLAVLDYGVNERNLKIEISNRRFPDRYEIKNYLGISVNVMAKPDMFAHKLCALLDRNMIAHRDIFDIYYFMKQKTPVNKNIVEERTTKSLDEYLNYCIENIEKVNNKQILDGLGELVDEKLKTFVRKKLKNETIHLLKMYKEFPLLG